MNQAASVRAHRPSAASHRATASRPGVVADLLHAAGIDGPARDAFANRRVATEKVLDVACGGGPFTEKFLLGGLLVDVMEERLDEVARPWHRVPMARCASQPGVWSEDPRVAIFNPVLDGTVFPYSAIVDISTRHADGAMFRGSGAVVGPNDVLTAAHVVADDPIHGEVVDIVVTPGLSGGSAPFGEYRASDRVWYPVDEDGDGFLTYDEVRRDYAILTVEDPAPIGARTGWFRFDPAGLSTGSRIALTMAGYPAGPQDGGPLDMFRGFDVELFDGALIVHDYEDQTGLDLAGASGSPLWREVDGDPSIVAVTSTASWAAYLSSEAVETIAEWVADNGDGDTPRPDAPSALPPDAAPPRQAPKVGSEAADTLRGGPEGDWIDALAGDDVIATFAGDDTVDGGDGADVIKTGAGDDDVDGGAGPDFVVAGDGADLVRGGDGDDTIKPGRGNDTVFGGNGDDLVAGFRGDERFEGGDGNDRLLGSVDNDTLIGGAGDDRLWGGPGFDVFVFEERDFGTDRLPLDMRVGSDVLDFTAIDGLTREDFTIRQAGINVVLDVEDGGRLIMNGVRFGGLFAEVIEERFDEFVLLG
jgi:V8-like Glu-specific endopeptidase